MRHQPHVTVVYQDAQNHDRIGCVEGLLSLAIVLLFAGAVLGVGLRSLLTMLGAWLAG